jgi:pantoate--beta-alanine ligase
MTKVIKSLAEWQALRPSLGDDLGFVPTMGNLHEGHLSLLRRAQKESKVTVLSIFVNPTQFNSANDYIHYPRTLEADVALAESVGVDYVFAPPSEELYPDSYGFQVSEVEFSELLEGRFRPGHFTGMLTIVLKLLLIVAPKRLYVGEKDFQQAILIGGLTRAFFINTEVVICPTVRNEFGLALSSRNSRLTPEQYEQARLFPSLFHSNLPCEDIKKQLEEKGFAVDYVEEYDGRRFAAVKLGEVRLIDNIEVKSTLYPTGETLQ